MEWLQSHAVEITALCGAFLAIWNVVMKIDKALIDHLDDKFASKQDFERLEKKVDTMLGAVIRRSNSSRSHREE